MSPSIIISEFKEMLLIEVQIICRSHFVEAVYCTHILKLVLFFVKSFKSTKFLVDSLTALDVGFMILSLYDITK